MRSVFKRAPPSRSRTSFSGIGRGAVGLLLLALVALVGVLLALPTPGARHPAALRGASALQRGGVADLVDLRADGGWQPLGEPGVGGRVTGLAVDPADSSDILVGGDMLGVGLSQDGGKTWQATSGFSSWEMNAFTWDVAHPARVWVGSLSGPYESSDGGKTWQSMRVGMPTGDYPYSAPIQKVLIDAGNDQHLLAFGGNQRQFVKAGTGAVNFGVVYESTDGGAHWAQISTIGANYNITDVVGTGDLSTLYASVVGHGVYRSSDGGHTWTAIDSGLVNQQAMGLAIDPSNSSTVWVALAHAATLTGGVYAAGGIYKTTDGGLVWSSANTGLPQIAQATASFSTGMLSILRAGDGTLYTADQGSGSQGRFASTDGGAHWTAVNSYISKFYPGATAPYVWASNPNGSLVIGGSDSVYATTDHGASWQDIGDTDTTDGWHGNGYSGLLGTRVVFDPAQPNLMFVSGYDSGNLLRSDNAGESWTRPTAAYDNYDGGYDISVGGTGGNDVYEVLGQAGIFNGIAVSHDAGQTFTYHSGGTLPARYAVGSNQASIAIASPNGDTAYAVLPDGHLYQTTNSGSTWTQIPLTATPTAVTYNPTNHTTYIATSGGVYAIPAGGSPALMSGSPAALHRMIVTTDGTIYATGPLGSSTQSGLWALRSGGWSRLSSSKWVSDVAVDPSNPARIVYVTNDNPYHATSYATGVWVSCDDGASFSAYNPGLPMLRIMSVAFNPSVAGSVVIGTDGRGYWQTQLPSCG